MELQAIPEKSRVTVIQQQILHFNEKVTLSSESFTQTNSYEMLFLLNNSAIQKQMGELDSIWKLRQLCTSEASQDSGENTPEIVYGKWFLKYIDYLRELKRNFAERVYFPLIKFCFHGDSRAVSRDSMRSSMSNRSPSPTLREEDPILQMKKDFDHIADLYDYSSIEVVAARLGYLMERWEQLLDDEGHINPDLFSLGSQLPERSKDEAISYKFENFLRVVPDILLKSQNAVRFSNHWLQMDSHKRLSSKERFTKLKELKSDMTDKLDVVEYEVRQKEAELHEETEKYESLAKSEDRFNAISSMISNLAEVVSSLQPKVETCIQEKDISKNRLKSASTNSSSESYGKLQDIYLNHKVDLYSLTTNLRILNFHHKLLEEDLLFEIEARATLQKAKEDTQMRIKVFETTIASQNALTEKITAALIKVSEDFDALDTEIEKDRLEQELRSSQGSLRGSKGIQ